MQFSNVKRIGILTAAAVAALRAASMASAAETIYFTDADSGAPGGLPQLVDTGSGAHTGTFAPSGGANSILSVSGGNSFYVPAYANNINSGSGDTTDYVNVSGFTPTTDNVFIGLKLNAGGTPISPSDTTDLDTIINSINSDNNSTFGTNIASLVPPSFEGVFGGYDILISVPNSFASAGTGSNGQYDFGFDTSSYNVGGQISVTDIGVVPEPGCLGILTAAGWVLFPRYRRYRRA